MAATAHDEAIAQPFVRSGRRDAATVPQFGVGNAAGKAGDTNPQARAEARAVYQSGAANADALGNAVSGGEGEFERPTLGADPAKAQAFEQALKAVQLNLNSLMDIIKVEKEYAVDEQKLVKGINTLNVYAKTVFDYEQHSVVHLDARCKIIGDEIVDIRVIAVGDPDTAIDMLDDVAGQIKTYKTKAETLKRPEQPWDTVLCFTCPSPILSVLICLQPANHHVRQWPDDRRLLW